MFAPRGRGGPSRGTPANVQCQKCLKRGHYSYECKGSSQDRPYVSRPSRSKQLRNPKLVPELTNDTLDPLEKKGAADEQLAKIATERANSGDKLSRRHRSRNSRSRSPSSRSVSTISTASRSRSPEPSHQRPVAPVTKDGGQQHASSRRRYRSRSRSRSRSSSPYDRRSRSPPRQNSAPKAPANSRRDRSLSPFSKRLALTRQTN